MNQSVASSSRISVSNAPILIVVGVMIAFLAFDMSISNVADILGGQLASASGVAAFVAMAAAYAVGQYFILDFVKKRNKEVAARTARPDRINTLVTIVQYVLTAIVVLVAFQVALSSYYYTATLIANMTISYGLASAIMGLLSMRFFSWYRSNKGIATLLYALSAATITISTLLMLAFFDTLLLSKPAVISPQSQATFGLFDPGSTLGILQISFTAFNIVNFALLWSGTALLLRHYSSRVGRVKLWAILSVPLISFLSIFFVVTPLVAGSTSPDANMIFVIIFGYTLPGIISGILFGTPFWMVARSISHPAIKSQMIITACGFALSFVSASATVGHAPFPPLGLAGVSFFGLSSYLIMSGLYSSVVIMSEDARLRQEIRRSAMQESRLLDSIGLAQIEGEIQKRVTKIAEDHADAMTSQSGIRPTLTEDDMKNYLDLVMKEIKSTKKADGEKVKDARDTAA